MGSSQIVVFSGTIDSTNNANIHNGLNSRWLKSRQSLLRACWCVRRRTGAFNRPLPKCRGQVSSGVPGSGPCSFFEIPTAMKRCVYSMCHLKGVTNLLECDHLSLQLPSVSQSSYSVFHFPTWVAVIHLFVLFSRCTQLFLNFVFS